MRTGKKRPLTTGRKSARSPLLVGYDLDGVLAEAPQLSTKPWRWMTGEERRLSRTKLYSHYLLARPLMSPVGSRVPIVISARKKIAATEKLSFRWLQDKYPRCNGFELHLFEGIRSYTNVIDWKARTIRKLKLTDFIEDDRTVVRGLRRILKKRVRVWHYIDGRLDAL